MQVADFFCGGGGFSEGFRQAGFQIVFAVDKWEPAVTTYKGNKPDVNVIQDDVIRLSQLSDNEFDELIPDTEIIIGSPPCQAFSSSNKSGYADKTLGIVLIEAYLRIIARKKFKKNSKLKYWVLENVPNSRLYIKDEYTANDLELEGDFVLKTRCAAAGIYNAKNFGAPTNRKRFLCGDFPELEITHTDDNPVVLRAVLDSLGNPLAEGESIIEDVNYPGFKMRKSEITDFSYIHEVAPFEWEIAKRLKQDKGYMGKMSFPENLDKPARTVMATLTSCAREAMILGYLPDRYRLPTVREAASMMSFPIDYRFYGKTRGIKQTLVGNAVPPKLSFAVARAIAKENSLVIPNQYVPIQHDTSIEFVNLNNVIIPIKKERPRRSVAKFRYHIPYLIIRSYRVELTNYHSNFEKELFKWDAEIHYSQGKKRAAVYTPQVSIDCIPAKYREDISSFINNTCSQLDTFTSLQINYCKTTEQRRKDCALGPYELLDTIKAFINKLILPVDMENPISIDDKPNTIPNAILIGYYILKKITEYMGGKY